MLRLVTDGTLGVYINPGTQWIVISGGVLLFFVSLGVLKNNFSATHLTFGAIVLLIVALLITVVKPLALSVETAKLRSAKNILVTSDDRGERIGRKTSEFGILDWLIVLSDPGERTRYANREVSLSGFFLWREGEPMVGRLMMTCCGADAQPIFLPLVFEGPWPEENTWIQVNGTMQLSEEKSFILVTNLSLVDPPRNPYAE